jgi:competence protein ComEC
MTAIVLLGVMVDRPALTLRTLAVAAMGVLIVAPESVVHPSFQMSFAAALALIAAYERGLPWTTAGANSSIGARIALWGGRELLALVLASLVAGLATTPYSAYHFHRLAPYGVVANLLAMPIISALVMPAGVLALVAIPFGLDSVLWQLMGQGIGWMMAVALWVAGLPGAVGRISAFGTGPLILGTFGLVLACLLKTPLRWCGALVDVTAVAWAVRAPQPDILVAEGAQAFAARTAQGRLAILKTGNDAFAIREWLAADGDDRSPTDPTLADGWGCDLAGCVTQLSGGLVVAVALSPDSLRRTAAVRLLS